MKKLNLLKLKCFRCGHEWIRRVERPVRCARCGSYNWDSAPKNEEVESPKESRPEKKED